MFKLVVPWLKRRAVLNVLPVPYDQNKGASMPSVHADPTFKSDLQDSLQFIFSFTRNSGISGVMCQKSWLRHFEFLIVCTKHCFLVNKNFFCKQIQHRNDFFFFATCQKK